LSTCTKLYQAATNLSIAVALLRGKRFVAPASSPEKLNAGKKPPLEFVHLRDTFRMVAIVGTAGRDAGGKLCQPEAGAHLSQLEMSAGFQPA